VSPASAGLRSSAGTGAIGISSRPVAAALLAAWTAMIWTVCTTRHVPHVPSYAWVPWAWNLGHAPLFGGFSALLAVTLRPGRCPGPHVGAARRGATSPLARTAESPADADARRDARIWLAAALAGVVFGALIEWRQAYVPGRTASALDVVTDTMGAFGVPWALSTGSLLTWRTAVVFVAGGLAALAATYL
jgi:hypothetical protein